MSERSAKWLKKRSFLDQREAEVKDELAQASDSLESGVKKVLVATAAVGATLVTGYMIYRAFRPKKKPEPIIETAQSPQMIRVPKKQKFSVKNAIFERLTLIAIQFIGTQLAILLAKNKQEDKHIG